MLARDTKAGLTSEGFTCPLLANLATRMTTTDYLIDSALVLLVLLQIKERPLTTKALIRPLVIVAIAVVNYLHGVANSGIDTAVSTRVEPARPGVSPQGRLERSSTVAQPRNYAKASERLARGSDHAGLAASPASA